MSALENIALIAVLMILGVGIAWAMLVGFIYWLEIQDE
jgi:hypothetical protein